MTTSTIITTSSSNARASSIGSCSTRIACSGSVGLSLLLQELSGGQFRGTATVTAIAGVVEVGVDSVLTVIIVVVVIVAIMDVAVFVVVVVERAFVSRQ